jgi:hypothetical protein
MNIHFGTPNLIKAIADAVALYGEREFESARRSTVPMLALLAHAPGDFKKIVCQLGFPSEFDLFLEYTVRPPKGRGKASHSDVMLKSGAHALAIEAKWTEPMYQTVAKWLKAGKDQANRMAVLEGWLSLLQQRTAKPLQAGDFHPAIYQMVHRAASAATAEMPGLAYFLFKPSPDDRAADPDDVHKKLTDLWDRLGKPSTFPFHVVEIETKPLDAYEPLGLLPKGDEATAEAVCAALQDSKPLFDFTSYRVRPITELEADQ